MSLPPFCINLGFDLFIFRVNFSGLLHWFFGETTLEKHSMYVRNLRVHLCVVHDNLLLAFLEILVGCVGCFVRCGAGFWSRFMEEIEAKFLVFRCRKCMQSVG